LLPTLNANHYRSVGSFNRAAETGDLVRFMSWGHNFVRPTTDATGPKCDRVPTYEHLQLSPNVSLGNVNNNKGPRGVILSRACGNQAYQSLTVQLLGRLAQRQLTLAIPGGRIASTTSRDDDRLAEKPLNP
jgi:hypothetical protein